MSSQSESPTSQEAHPAHPLHERSDQWIATVLGRDLQGATIRAVLYLLIVGVVLATVAALVG